MSILLLVKKAKDLTNNDTWLMKSFIKYVVELTDF